MLRENEKCQNRVIIKHNRQYSNNNKNKKRKEKKIYKHRQTHKAYLKKRQRKAKKRVGRRHNKYVCTSLVT